MAVYLKHNDSRLLSTYKGMLYGLTLLVVMLSCSPQHHAQVASATEIDKWVKERKWAGGLTLTPHATVNRDSFYAAWHRNKKLWDAAFSFLKNQRLDTMGAGKYPIIGEAVFASITEAPPHKKEEVQWESHRKYIDLQYIIKGKEMIGVADASTATVTKPYTPDAMNYTANGNYHIAEPGTFFLFFPNDAHCGTIKVEGCDLVKKIVIKIQIAVAE